MIEWLPPASTQSFALDSLSFSSDSFNGGVYESVFGFFFEVASDIVRFLEASETSCNLIVNCAMSFSCCISIFRCSLSTARSLVRCSRSSFCDWERYGWSTCGSGTQWYIGHSCSEVLYWT